MGLLCPSQTKVELVIPSCSLRLCSFVTSESQWMNPRFPGPLIPNGRISRELPDQWHSVLLASGVLHLSQEDGSGPMPGKSASNQLQSQAGMESPYFSERRSGQKAPARTNLPMAWATMEKFPHERHKLPFPPGVAKTDCACTHIALALIPFRCTRRRGLSIHWDAAHSRLQIPSL